MLQALVGAHAPVLPQQPLPRQEPEPDYTWKISNFTRRLARANSNNNYGMIESEPFFTSHGYKMKLWVCLNEASSGYSGYMGVYQILLKSDQDGTLAWPFTKCCTYVIVDQQDHLTQRQNIRMTLAPNGEEEFEKPKQRENASMGNPQFVKHSTLRTRQYIRNHAVYVKFLVDP